MPRMGESMRSRAWPPRREAACDAVDGELVGGGVADDAAFADVLAAGFELGLDEDDGVALPLGLGRGEGGEDGGEDESGGDEADVHGEEAGAVAELGVR